MIDGVIPNGGQDTHHVWVLNMIPSYLMGDSMWIAKTIDQARQYRHQVTGMVACVPTMGALHKGHVRLINTATQAGCRVIASIFVNPTQFGPDEDYDQYPRQLQEDLDICRQAQVAGVFCPPVTQMYPPDGTAIELSVPRLAGLLEGKHRPHYFAGVCRVVNKLFNIIQPDVACFGQKDYQQLKVIQAMVDDLAIPVRIIQVPTVREDDGLAVSSRNGYLSPGLRQRAAALYKALTEARQLVEVAGESDPGVVEAAMVQVLTAYQIDIDYAVVRHPKTLHSLDYIEPQLTGGVVGLVAGRLDAIRLIDSMVLGVPEA